MFDFDGLGRVRPTNRPANAGRASSVPDGPPSLRCAGRVASLLKRWLLGTHQDAVAPWQLPYYLDEFTFRFNRRTSKSRGKLFFRLMQQAVNTLPATYDAAIKASSPPQATQES
ncbi:MAG: transposase [Bryobacteraceae bacterium]